MDSLKKFFSNRLLYLLIIFLFAMGVIVFKLYDLQIVEHNAHSQTAGKLSQYDLPLDAPRGNIYDRNGVLLATNRTAYKVYMINIDDEQSVRDEMYLRLVELFDKNDDVYYNYLADYLVYPIAWGDKVDEEDESANMKAWINDMVEKRADKEFFDTPENAFRYLRETIFEIDPKYTDQQAYRIMVIRFATYRYGLDSLKPTVLATDCCKETAEYLTAASNDFPGVTTEKTYFRIYVNNESLGPILGYVRAISEEEYAEKKDDGYFADDVIGKLGIEAFAEDYLRGTRGYRRYVKKTDGTVCEVDYTAPDAGNDVYLTIDARLQQDAYTAIIENIDFVLDNENGKDNHGDCDAGTSVVTDVKTGEVLSMVTYPTYDNSIFIAPSTDEEAQQAIVDLFKDETSPSLNRATQGAYPIGSIIKPAIAVAAIESGVINAKTEYYCGGYITVGGRRQRCLAKHGSLDLEYAMARSCNPYFALAGIEVGIENVDKWIKAFGLGELTGLEISEYKGYRSNPDSMDIFEAGTFHKWTSSSTAQTCIGQLYTMFTPIQVSKYCGAIANGGYAVNMHLVKRVVSSQGELVYETPIEKTELGISSYALSSVQQAMLTMCNSYRDLQIRMSGYPENFLAGKTGTAQTGENDESSHAFFMCYAPAFDPQISIVVGLEHGAYSGYGFYSVRSICDSYFNGMYSDGEQGGISMYEGSADSRGDGTTLSNGFHSLINVIREVETP